MPMAIPTDLIVEPDGLDTSHPTKGHAMLSGCVPWKMSFVLARILVPYHSPSLSRSVDGEPGHNGFQPFPLSRRRRLALNDRGGLLASLRCALQHPCSTPCCGTTNVGAQSTVLFTHM